jgi:maleate isomerase
MVFPFDAPEIVQPRLGLIVLQSDETVEGDLRTLFPCDAECLVTRVPSGLEVTSQSLSEMEANLASAAGLFPRGLEFDVIGYGCTSGTAQIGAEAIATQIRAGAPARAVTEPLSALIDACRDLNLKRLAVLSPYVAEVSAQLRRVLVRHGIETPLVGSFNVSTEAVVARISPQAIIAAACDLMNTGDVDGLFVSCTNLRTLGIINDLEKRLGKPVLTSNQVLARHMLKIADLSSSEVAPGSALRDF